MYNVRPSSCSLCLMITRARKSTLFPYTTLFRSIYWDGIPYLPLGRDSVYLDPARISLAPLERDAGGVEVHRVARSEEHTSELQSRLHLVCRLLLEKKKHYDKRSNSLSPHYTT